jgi:hypothetical protein
VDGGRSRLEAVPHHELVVRLGDGASDRLYGHAYEYLANFGDRAASAMAGLCRLSDPGIVRERLQAIAETGCDEVVLVPTTDDVAELDRLLAAIA